MKKLQIIPLVLMFILCAVYAHAAQIKVFVTDINAIGVQNKDEMKSTLRMLLSSRLNGDTIMVVGTAAEADVLVSGTYVTIGKVFSVDALVKTAAGKALTRAFVQGESQDELIPSIGKLANKLTVELNKIYSGSPALAGAVSASTSPAPASTLQTPKSDIIRNVQIVPAPAGEIIKAHDAEQAAGSWLSQRLNGAANLMAVGKSLPDGSREIFLAEARRISYYRQGQSMKLVSDTELGVDDKILSLDTLEGTDGVLDIYVTVIRAEELASQVWQVKGDKLVLVADKLPWFFRSFRLAGGTKKLYAQAMGRTSDFFGNVAEASRSGSHITLVKTIPMPRYGNIYTFNQFRTNDGNMYTVVINPDGYLIVYDQALKELWRSNDTFGGSELYFLKVDDDNVRTTGNKYRWEFMNMRIQVTAKGDILVGKNDGFWVLGNARSYKKGSVLCMFWNGSSLEEKWHTRETQNYLPDYYFDDNRNELLMLQTVQRPGVSTRGASSLAIKKVE
ncbi:MAG: VCBS repeat-containing protein [Geobacteraceae bacterium]|nr:VCBS repeat-containing protein [Geobacteraceae bacterium]